MNVFTNPSNIVKGFPFSVTLMIILGTHEAGHYIFAKRGNVAVTYPYFIPAPSFLGTFGAFIKIKSPVPNRNVLIKFSAAGPIAGFLAALPAVIIGLALSEIKDISNTRGILLGSSILFNILSQLIVGVVPDSYDIVLHPIAFAGWIGFFVTALNLLPVSQLDGGHILYAFSERWHRWLSKVIIIILIPLGFYWEGWFIWAILISIFGSKHPPVIDEVTQSTYLEQYLAIISLAILILTFVPIPFNF